MPSHWQQRYPSERVLDDDDDDDNSLGDWIADVQRRADVNESYSYSYGALDVAPTDADVADVISRLEQILNTTVDTADDQNASFHFDDYLELSSTDSLTQTTPDDHIVESIRNQSSDRVKRRCYDELVKNCKSEKKRLGWIEKLLAKQQRMKILSNYLLRWKSINRMVRLREVMLACKIGRVTSNKFRRVFVEWRRLILTRREQLSKVDSRKRRKVYRRVFSALIQNKQISLLTMERSRERLLLQRKSKVFSSWRGMARNQMKLGEDAEQFHRSRVKLSCFVSWSMLPREGGSPDSLTNAENEQITVNNQRPSPSEDDKLLKPLRMMKSRRRPSLSNSKPKVVTDMNQRNDERRKRKEVLRSRNEKMSIAKKQVQDAERHSQEERELRVHNAFIRRKVEEKQLKEQEAIRRKDANRLAILHYKFSLQKRFLLRWKRIFGINGWNERKAAVFLRDAAYEKYFSSWFRYSKNKALRVMKRHHLAVDFHETSLLSKAFASLEEHVKHSHHLHDKATSTISTFRKQAVLREWHRKTLLLLKERETKEIEAGRTYQTFLLRRALHGWKVGVDMSREEERMEKLVNEKYAAMMEWLEASRNDNDPY